MIDQTIVREKLSEITYPSFDKDIVAFGFVKEISASISRENNQAYSLSQSQGDVHRTPCRERLFVDMEGAMVTQAIEQMIEDIEWGRLDILLFDMPPGTGDAQLALAQSLPITAGVCVTTPQKVALDDAIRSMDMFKQLHIPIAGVVENMSGFISPESGKEYAIFGKGTTEPLAQAYDTEVLGNIPIEPAIREGGDSGLPITVVAPNCESAKRYQIMATKLWDKLSDIQEEGGVSNKEIQPTIF